MNEPENSPEAVGRAGWINIIGLSVAQLLCAMGQVTMITLAGILGAELAPDPQLATLPIAAGIVGLAAAAMPVSLLVRRFGRQRVFGGFALWAAAGAALSAWAISGQSFAGFCLGSFMMGNNLAAMAQYRFAVADSVPVAYISRAVAAIMLGTLVSALLAPMLALGARDLLDTEFAGSLIVLVVPFCAGAAIVFCLPLPARHALHADAPSAGSAGEVLRRPDVQLAIVAGAVGYSVMTLIMTATPISMHVIDGMSVAVTANVIRAHMLAMFIPSLFSGWLISRLGVIRALWLGLLLEFATVIVNQLGQTEADYMLSLILLGAGWNFLFVGGTTLLASSIPDAFKYRVQGINELLMFGSMAISSLAAGPLLLSQGWVSTNLVGGSLLILVVIAIARTRAILLPA